MIKYGPPQWIIDTITEYPCIENEEINKNGNYNNTITNLESKMNFINNNNNISKKLIKFLIKPFYDKKEDKYIPKVNDYNRKLKKFNNNINNNKLINEIQMIPKNINDDLIIELKNNTSKENNFYFNDNWDNNFINNSIKQNYISLKNNKYEINEIKNMWAFNTSNIEWNKMISKRNKICKTIKDKKVLEHSFKIIFRRFEPIYYDCKWCKKENFKDWDEKFNHNFTCKKIKKIWNECNNYLDLDLESLNTNLLLLGISDINNINIGKIKFDNKYLNIVKLHYSIDNLITKKENIKEIIKEIAEIFGKLE